MEQIDIMVSNKKLDWERKMRALETRLDLRDQELANAQTCLDQKGQEVGLLRQKLDSLEKCNLMMTQNYEGQLQALKAQFSKLTNSFEKLRLHQMKQSQVHRKEVPSKEEIPFELNSLNQKLEKQAQNYQTQLNGKKQCPEDISPENPHMMCDSDPGCEASQRDEFIIEKLKSAVSEIALSRNKLQDENQKLLQELKMCQRQCQIRSQMYQEEDRCTEQERMRIEISDLTQELHRKEMTIATVMKKAALLERQLKIELEIKEKMLTKQQSMDFADKEQTRYTSINKLEYENERLRNDLAKLSVDGKAAWPNQSSYDEAGTYPYQSHLKMDTSGDRLSQDCELNTSPTPPLPPLPFQTKEMTSPLVSDDEVFPLSPPDISFPASLTAQHFLMEEERRAKELEKLLNTHIDELQRHTEFTLNKYTKLKQSRHV
ncbi:Coiled-coil domain-containing protein 67 [Cricetulus griseus]|nr:Coiled-coil domain-containing protein 67 [Cricetulus griseus]